MRSALRSGNLWIEGSRRYTNPETYLIPTGQWSDLRDEACRQMKVPEDGWIRLKQRAAQLDQLASALDQDLGGKSKVRLEDGELTVGRLEAEERPASATRRPCHDTLAMAVALPSTLGPPINIPSSEQR